VTPNTQEPKHLFNQISGVPITAYSSDGTIDEKASGAIASKIARAGVKNVIAAGNTGEFFSLSLDEIHRLHSVTAHAVGSTGLVTASVGRALVEAKQMVTKAVQAGVGAVMVHWPADPFAGPSHKVDYFVAIAEHSPVPTIAYIRSDEIGLDDLVRLAEHPNVAAIKYANTNLMGLADAIRSTHHCDTVWVCGLAEGWAPPFYALGARGFTSGLVNVFPQISIAIYEALEAGNYDQARMLIDEIEGFEKMRTHYNNGSNVTVVKEAMELMGSKPGPVRLPGVTALSELEKAQLKSLVSRLTSLEVAS